MSTATREDTLPIFNFYTGLAVLTISLGCIYLMIKLPGDSSGLIRLYILMAIQLTPLALSLSRRHNNYISFIMFNHFFTYSLAKYNQIANITKVSELAPGTLHAIEELTFCTLLIIFGYYSARQLIFYRFVVQEKYEMICLGRTHILIIGTYVCLQTVLLRFLPHTFHTLHFVTSALCLVILLTAKAPGYETILKVFQWSTGLNAIYYFLNSGSLAILGSLASTLFMVLCLKRKYKQILLLVMFAFTMSLIQPVKSAYRHLIVEQPSMGIVDKLEALSDLLYLKYVEGENIDPKKEESGSEDNSDITENTEEFSSTLLKGFARIGDDSLERVLTWTPSVVPFWGGETYANIPYMFIPRFLWPEKPPWLMWNKFGRTYGILSSDDMATSVGVGYLGEAYMNFGYSGMYICALVFGYLVALVERLSYFFLNGHFHFTFICFLIPLMGYAADFGSLLNSIVLITSVMVLFRGQFLKMARRDEYS